MIDKINFIEAAGRVQRCHTVPTLHPQNVAAHSYGVAWWCYLLTDGNPSAALLLHALGHDNAEHVTGDIPAPTKRALNISQEVDAWESEILSAVGLHLPAITEEESRILKVADCLELMQHCTRERALGNRSKALLNMYCNICNYVNEVVNTDRESERQAYVHITSEWRLYDQGK